MTWGSPPLARGIRQKQSWIHGGIRITPACAGNTLLVWLRGTGEWDHPRLRGEYIILSEVLFEKQGSPPLARGIH